MMFSKKPVVIEARQYDGSLASSTEIINWAHITSGSFPISLREEGNQMILQIVTLEGTMDVSPKDWVIKGLKGEFYPCKPDIFDLTYDKVGE